MARVELIMPKMGESVSEATIINHKLSWDLWLVDRMVTHNVQLVIMSNIVMYIQELLHCTDVANIG